MNYYDLVQNGFFELLKSGIEEKIAKQDAEDLILHSLKITKTELLQKYNKNINDFEKNIYNNLIQQRKTKKPLSYITHNAIFFGYNFFVNESTLIPRIDSEILIENALDCVVEKKNKKRIKILDACCGSGCLGISLVKAIIDKKKEQFDSIELTLMDISSPAIQVAKINVQKLLQNDKINVNYIINNVLVNGLGSEKYDIILCNPPYIESKTIADLDDEVKNFEPSIAIDGGSDGLKFYKTISLTIRRNFLQNCIAFFEIGYNQGYTVNKIFTDLGFCTEIKKDYGHNDRCIILKYNV